MCCLFTINKLKKLRDGFNLKRLMMKKFKLQIVIFIFIFLALQETSFTVARPVKKVTTKREMAVGGDGDCFSLRKENIPVERFARIGGRKLTGEVIKGKSKKVSHFVGNRKGDEENNLMAFASDYHPPKPHPPKNN